MLMRVTGVVALCFVRVRGWDSWRRSRQFIDIVVDDAPDQGVIF